MSIQYTRPSQYKPPSPEELARREAERKQAERKAIIRVIATISYVILANIIIAVVAFFFYGGLSPALLTGSLGFGISYLGAYLWIKLDSMTDFGKYFNTYDGRFKRVFFIPAYLVEIIVFAAIMAIYYLGKGIVILVLKSFQFNSFAGILIFYTIYSLFAAIFYATFPSRLPLPSIPQQSPLQSQLTTVENLSQIQLISQQSLDSQVIIHPYVLENRLFVEIASNNSTAQIEIPQKMYTRFHERIMLNLRFKVNLDYSERLLEQTVQLQEIIASQELVSNKSTVLIADGALQNINYQHVFQGKLIFRSSTLNAELIANNLSALSQAPSLSTNNTVIVNGIPSSPEELVNLKLNSTQWSEWTGIHQAWQSIIENHSYGNHTGKTAADAMDAFKQSANVVIVVAHSDGQTIYFPDGSSLTVSNLESIKEDIGRNRPIVILLACETAQVKDGLVPFSQSLINLGAKAVVAPVSEIGAKSTSQFLDDILQNSAENDPPIEAIWKAIQDGSGIEMENWIGLNQKEFFSKS